MQLVRTDARDLRGAYGAWVPGENGVAGARFVPADTSIHRMQQGVRLAIVAAVIAGGLRLGWVFAR